MKGVPELCTIFVTFPQVYSYSTAQEVSGKVINKVTRFESCCRFITHVHRDHECVDVVRISDVDT